jgi:hypothetical protein
MNEITTPIDSKLAFQAYLNDSFSLPKNENEIQSFLNKVESKINYIGKRNVITLAILLEIHVFHFLDKPEIRSKYESIVNAIFNKTNKLDRHYIHQFAREGADEKVRALVRIAPQKFNIKSHSNKTPLSYAEQYQKDKYLDIITYLKMFDRLSASLGDIQLNRLIDIRCKRGNPPAGLNRNEGLVQVLGQADLQIIKKMPLQNVNYYFTQTFTYNGSCLGSRPLIFCFVEENNALYPRLFWLSKSQSIWRRLDKVFKNWIGKSKRREEALGVPFQANLQIFNIHKWTQETGIPNNLPNELGEKLFKYVVAWSDNKVGDKVIREGRVVLEIIGDPVNTTDVGPDSLSNEQEEGQQLGPPILPPDPQNNDCLKPAFKPDFSVDIPATIITSPHYGKLKARIVLSSNREIGYLFLETQDQNAKYAFLAAVEIANAPITKLGLKKEWIDSENLTLPLAEYSEQFFDDSPKFRDQFWSKHDKDRFAKKPFKGYVSTWNYLREMPFIIDYYAKLHHSQPPPKI